MKLSRAESGLKPPKALPLSIYRVLPCSFPLWAEDKGDRGGGLQRLKGAGQISLTCSYNSLALPSLVAGGDQQETG